MRLLPWGFLTSVALLVGCGYERAPTPKPIPVADGDGGTPKEEEPPKRKIRPAAIPVGTQAPEIEAEDIDGVPFKLSDYRGKVVLLDFWGNW